MELYNPFDISIYYCYQKLINQFLNSYIYFIFFSCLFFHEKVQHNIIPIFPFFKTRSILISYFFNRFDCYQKLFPKSAFFFLNSFLQVWKIDPYHPFLNRDKKFISITHLTLVCTCYQQLFPKSAFLSHFFFVSMKNCNISSLVFPSKMWKLVEVLQEISPLSEQDFLRKCIQSPYRYALAKLS